MKFRNREGNVPSVCTGKRQKAGQVAQSSPARNCGSLEHAAPLVLLNRLDGMADHGLELLWHALARVGEVNLVMEAGFGEVGRISLFRRKCAHGAYGRRFVVVRPGVHALNA